MKCYKVVLTGKAARKWAHSFHLSGADMVYDYCRGTYQVMLLTTFFKRSGTSIRSCIRNALSCTFGHAEVRAPVAAIWTMHSSHVAYAVDLAQTLSVARGDLGEATRFREMVMWVLDQTMSTQRRLKYDERTGTCVTTRRLYGRNEVLRSPSIRKRARR